MLNIYRSITKSEVHNGKLTLFWKYFWCENELLCDKFPHLYSYVLNEDSSVAEMASIQAPGHHFALPLLVQAFEEREQIQQILDSVDHDSLENDSHIFSWGNKTYTSAKYYNFIFARAPQNKVLQSIWKSRCLPKLRVFVWLLLMDRLNTKDLMLRKDRKSTRLNSSHPV